MSQYSEHVRKILRRNFKGYKRLSNGRIVPCGKDFLVSRQNLLARIHECAEDGMVAIVSGGIDCDGVQWDNDVTYVAASVAYVEWWERDFNYSAEGRQWWYLEEPSKAKYLEASFRDRTLEAFENGHPWSI